MKMSTRAGLVLASIASVVLFSMPAVAQAQNVAAIRQQVEASMLVTGSVDVAPDGSVVGHAFDDEDKLPPYVVKLVSRAVPALRFEPIPAIEGAAPVVARATMGLRLLAVPADGGNMEVRLHSAHFGEAEPPAPGTIPSVTSRRRPEYPVDVAMVGGQGTVYLLVKIGRDGRAREVAAEQVNLTAIGSAREMASIRASLAKSAIETVSRHWRFAPPTLGDAADEASWMGRVTVDYRMAGYRERGYGEWSAYHPGPKQTPAWAAPPPPGFSPDTLVAGELTSDQSRFRLVTPIGG